MKTPDTGVGRYGKRRYRANRIQNAPCSVRVPRRTAFEAVAPGSHAGRYSRKGRWYMKTPDMEVGRYGMNFAKVSIPNAGLRWATGGRARRGY